MSKTLSDRIADIRATADEINARMDGEGGNDAGADQTGDKGGDGYPEGLGDPGKRALDAMKSERNQAKSEHAALKAEFEAYKAANPATQSDRNGGQENDKPKDEPKSSDQIRDEVTQKVTADYNQRVLRSDVRRLAEGRLTDSGDALRYLDLSDLSPDAHGEYDQAAITSKLDKLLEGRPYLAAASKPNFQGGADSGTRADSSAPDQRQLTREDMLAMNPLDREKARKEGRFADLLSGKLK